MKIHIPVALCALALASALSVSSHAQPQTFSGADRKFLTDAAQGSIYDLLLAQLAAGRATSSATACNSSATTRASTSAC